MIDNREYKKGWYFCKFKGKVSPYTFVGMMMAEIALFDSSSSCRINIARDPEVKLDGDYVGDWVGEYIGETRDNMERDFPEYFL